MDNQITIVVKLIDQASAQMQQVATNASRAFSGIQNAAQGAVGLMQSALSKLPSSFAEAAGGAYMLGNMFANDLSNAVLSASWKLRDFAGPVASVVTGGFNLMKSVGTTAFKGLGSAVSTVTSTIKNNLTTMAEHARWASAILGGMLVGAMSEAVSMAAKFERFGAAAEFMTGSAEGAREFAKAVRELSTATMFNVDQIADMESKLVGNTKNVGQSTAALRALTDAVAATGGGYGELEGVVRSWIQVNAKARLSSEELNRQFANANIPMVRLLGESIAKDLNHPMRQYMGIAKGAKVSTNDVIAKLSDLSKINIPGAIAAESITRALNEAYGGANQKLIDTFDGQMSMLGDTLKLTALSFMGLDESFKPVKGGLLDMLKSALTPIVKFLQDHQQDIQNFASSFSHNLPAMMAFAGFILGILLPAIAGLVAPLIAAALPWMAIGAAIGFVIDQMGGINAILAKLKQAWDFVAPAVNLVVGAFNTVANWIKSNKVIMDGFALGLKIIAGIIALVFGVIIVSAIASAIAAAWPFIVAITVLIGVVMAIGVAIKAIIWAFPLLVGKVKEVGAAIGNFFTKTVPQALEAAGKAVLNFAIGLIKAYIGLYVALFNLFMMAVNWLVEGAKSVGESVGRWFTEMYQKVSIAVTNMANTIGKFVTDVIAWFAALPSNIWNFAVKLFLQDIPYAIGFMLSFIYNQVPRLLGELVGWFIQTGVNVWNEVSSWPGKALNYILQTYTNFQFWVAKTRDDTVALIIETATNVWNEVATWPGRAVTWLSSMWTNFWTWFGKTKTDTWNFISSLATDIWNEVSTWPSKAWTWLSSMWNQFWTWFGKVKTDVGNAIVGATTAIWNEVSTWPSKIAGWLSSIPGKFGEAMNSAKESALKPLTDLKNKVDEIIGGIKKTIDDLIGKAKGAWGTVTGSFQSGWTAGMGQTRAHGGIVSGPLGAPVPIIAHGGERIEPLSMAKDNQTGNSVAINFYGNVQVDSSERVKELADQISRILGRQNELARFGAGF